MPEMVASYSSQRFSAMLDFQREVDLVYPSHIGSKSSSSGVERKAPQQQQQQPGHHRAHHGGDNSWQHNWSESLSAFLASTFRRDDTPCAVQAVTRSQGQFSPHSFIRSALKRAFARDGDSSVVSVKRSRFESTAEPMVCG